MAKTVPEGSDITRTRREAEIFTRYLIGRAPDKATVKLYVHIMQQSKAPIEAGDAQLLSFATRHAWSIGLLDSFAALFRPHAELRRRLYTLLAILESSPEYHDYFLPKQRSFVYLIFMGYAGARAVLKTAGGTVLAGLVRLT